MRGGRTFPAIPLLTGLMLLAWPFLIGFGLTHNSLHWLLPLMVLLLLLRLHQARQNEQVWVIEAVIDFTNIQGKQ